MKLQINMQRLKGYPLTFAHDPTIITQIPSNCEGRGRGRERKRGEVRQEKKGVNKFIIHWNYHKKAQLSNSGTNLSHMTHHDLADKTYLHRRQ